MRLIAPHIRNCNKPCLILTGPEGSGKTLLSQELFSRHSYCNFDDSHTRSLALKDPATYLQSLKKGVIFDELQKAPELWPFLSTAIEQNPEPAKWILVGSHSSLWDTRFPLSQKFLVLPFTREEMPNSPHQPKTMLDSIFFGGYPERITTGSTAWYERYMLSLMKEFQKHFTTKEEVAQFKDFLGLCSGRIGLTLDYASLAHNCCIEISTAKAWFKLLEEHYIAFSLPAMPLTSSKKPRPAKLYFYDVGFACWLLGIQDTYQLFRHYHRRKIFVSWMISEILKIRAGCSIYNHLWYLDEGKHLQVDLIAKHPSGHLDLIDGLHISIPDFARFDSLKHVEQALKQPASLRVVYAGDKTLETKGRLLTAWSDLHTIPWHTNPVVSASNI